MTEEDRQERYNKAAALIGEWKNMDSEDPGYCGVAPLETGAADPLWKQACQPHDWAYDKMKAGMNSSPLDNLKTQGTFIKNVGIAMLKASYTLLAGPLYIALGVGIGTFRWAFLVDKASSEGQNEDVPPINYKDPS